MSRVGKPLLKITKPVSSVSIGIWRNNWPKITEICWYSQIWLLYCSENFYSLTIIGFTVRIWLWAVYISVFASSECDTAIIAHGTSRCHMDTALCIFRSMAHCTCLFVTPFTFDFDSQILEYCDGPLWIIKSLMAVRQRKNVCSCLTNNYRSVSQELFR